MKLWVTYLSLLVCSMIASCASTNNSPTGYWQGKNGNESIGIYFHHDGKCSIYQGTKEMTGTWALLNSRNAAIKSEKPGNFLVKGANHGIYNFEKSAVVLNRTIFQPTTSAQLLTHKTSPAATNNAVDKKIQPADKKESYYLNELP